LIFAVVSDNPRIIDVKVTDESIIAYLAGGRIISVPLAWSWHLSEATPEQRSNFEIIGSGQGVHWPDVDEDISATGMLSGAQSRQSSGVGRLACRTALDSDSGSDDQRSTGQALSGRWRGGHG